MEFGQAFSFVFEDEEWLKKVGIAGLIMFIPLVGVLVVLGWSVEITKRVINNHAEPLPDWGDFMQYLVKGLQVFVIAFLYMLPVIVVQLCSTGGMAFMADSGDETLATVLGVLTVCLSCFVILYSILSGLVLPAAIGNFAAKDELKAAFSFGEVFGMVRKNLGAYALVLLGSIVSGFVASLGIIACGIGVAFTGAYAYAINGHLWGQAYRVASPGAGTGEVLEAVEPDLSADF